MATRAKSSARRTTRAPKAAKRGRTVKKAKLTKAKTPQVAGRKPARRANGSRKPKRQPGKKRTGRREAPIPRKAGAKAAKARARAADVMPAGGEGKSAASGRMHRVPGKQTKELSAPKPRPAGLTREQRKKATNEEGFGFKQIEERLDTTREKSGIVAERRKGVTEYEDEVQEGGVENSAGYVDYDKQERSSDLEPNEKPQADFEAPSVAEEE